MLTVASLTKELFNFCPVLIVHSENVGFLSEFSSPER